MYPTWAPGPVTRCPVLLFDEELEQALALFDHCYRRTAQGRHERVALPAAGTVLDQDAWLLEAMEIIAETIDGEAARQAEAATLAVGMSYVRRG